MTDFSELNKTLEDIRRRVNSFRKLEPEDILIQHEKILPELETIKTVISSQIKDDLLKTGELSTFDLLQLITVMGLHSDTKIELCFSMIKARRKSK